MSFRHGLRSYQSGWTRRPSNSRAWVSAASESGMPDSSRAISLLGLQGACIGNGILTVENLEQAQVRAGKADKGGGAAAAALHLVALSRKWARQTKGIGFLA